MTGDWSKSGGDGQPQPDNREFLVEGQHDEACVAVLNNFYGDGAVSINCLQSLLSISSLLPLPVPRCGTTSLATTRNGSSARTATS